MEGGLAVVSTVGPLHKGCCRCHHEVATGFMRSCPPYPPLPHPRRRFNRRSDGRVQLVSSTGALWDVKLDMRVSGEWAAGRARGTGRGRQGAAYAQTRHGGHTVRVPATQPHHLHADRPPRRPAAEVPGG